MTIVGDCVRSGVGQPGHIAVYKNLDLSYYVSVPTVEQLLAELSQGLYYR